jgi:membrane dipeptidase
MPALRSVLAVAPLGLALCLPSALVAQSGRSPRDESAVLASAKAIHAKVLSIDTHVDIAPANFTESGPNYTQKLPRT